MMAILLKKGFVIILVVSMTAMLALVSWAIIDVGMGEALQTRTRNDTVSAYYLAQAGAEMMYAKLKDIERGSSSATFTLTWPVRIAKSDVSVSGNTIGTYEVTATNVVWNQPNVFAVLSKGTVNGRTATLTVKYGYKTSQTNGPPIGSLGNIYLEGYTTQEGYKYLVYAEGPVAAAGIIDPNSNDNDKSVVFLGEVLEHQTFASTPSFWLKYDPATGNWTQKTMFDTNGDNQYITDVNGDGKVTVEDIGAGDAAKIAIFNADNTYSSDDEINNKDAFYTYYTVELNTEKNLNIGPGQSNYYSGELKVGSTDYPQTLPSPTSSKEVFFVDGDVQIIQNIRRWDLGSYDVGIVSMGDIVLVNPGTQADDRITVIAYGGVTVGRSQGVLYGIGALHGNVVAYAGGDYYYLGGAMQGSMFSGGDSDIRCLETVDMPEFSRALFFPGSSPSYTGKATDDWSLDKPWALPPGYPQVKWKFVIKQENTSASGYKPRWQVR